LRTWELNPASRLMRPGRAPARPHLQSRGAAAGSDQW
jgi:hypothetical protein